MISEETRILSDTAYKDGLRRIEGRKVLARCQRLIARFEYFPVRPSSEEDETCLEKVETVDTPQDPRLNIIPSPKTHGTITMYQSTNPHPSYLSTLSRQIIYENPKRISPPGTKTLHSSPLTPPVTSPSSVHSTESAFQRGHDMGWLSGSGRTSPDKPRTAAPSSQSSGTGWGTPHHGPKDADGRTYSHDMANQYFTLAQQDGQVRKGAGGPGFMQRIMHRTKSLYPLPCDDQEQQVSRRISWSMND
jgi:hypothetical protein